MISTGNGRVEVRLNGRAVSEPESQGFMSHIQLESLLLPGPR
jgi:hypothetical protein